MDLKYCSNLNVVRREIPSSLVILKIHLWKPAELPILSPLLITLLVMKIRMSIKETGL